MAGERVFPPEQTHSPGAFSKEKRGVNSVYFHSRRAKKTQLLGVSSFHFVGLVRLNAAL